MNGVLQQMYGLALLYLVCPETFGEIILIFVFLKGRHWNGAFNVLPEVEGFQLSTNTSLPVREIRLPLEGLHMRRSALLERHDADES